MRSVFGAKLSVRRQEDRTVALRQSRRGVPTALALALAVGSAPHAQAGATTDGSVGQVRTLSGNFTIPQSLGRRLGPNLFHSFTRFNVDPGESATFITTSGSIRNVISRVTGGEPSTFHGLLALQAAAGSRPDFYFINPAGVVFGAGAEIDVPAGFRVSTAQRLKFADGFEWNTGDATRGRLTVAAPTAFGFVGGTQGAIKVDGGAVLLSRPGGSLSVFAADIGIDGAGVATSGGGDIRLGAVGSLAISVPLRGEFHGDGRIELLDGGFAVAESRDNHKGGDIFVGAGEIVVDSMSGQNGASQISTQAINADAGQVVVSASRGIHLTNGGQISSLAFAQGNAGLVSVSAATLTADGSGFGFTGVFSQALRGTTGNAAGVDVSVVGKLTLLNGAEIVSGSEGAGHGGPVRVASESLLADRGAGRFFTGILSFADGNADGAGDIAVTVRDDMTILNGAGIGSWTFTSGNAASIKVNAGSAILDEQDSPILTGIFSQAQGGTGNAGNIEVNVTGSLDIFSGAGISTDSNAGGKAGSVTVTAGTATFDGRNSPFTSGIFSQANSRSEGASGNIDVGISGDLFLRNGGLISSSTFAGDAGDISVRARNIEIDGQFNGETLTGIAAAAFTSAVGNGGNVFVAASEGISILNGGVISANTRSQGNAGSVKVTAENMRIDAGGRDSEAGIFATTILQATGDGGRIEVEVSGLLSMSAGGEISSATETVGDAGSVIVRAGRLHLDGADLDSLTSISSTATRDSRGSAGDVTVVVRDDLRVTDGALISSTTRSVGNAGAVQVTAGDITLDGTGSDLGTGILSDTFASGKAGSVTVSSPRDISLIGAAAIGSSTAGTGGAGSVRVSANNISIDGLNHSAGFGIVALSAGANSADAGDIVVTAREALSVVRGGIISAETFSSAGSAGSVVIEADSVAVDGSQSEITSAARPGSSGRTGDVTISASQVSLSNGGSLSIKNEGIVSDAQSIEPSLLTVISPSVTLTGASHISGESTGNVSASRVLLLPSASGAGSLSIAGDGTGEITSSVRLPRADELPEGVAAPLPGSGSGAAGDVELRAESLSLRGVNVLSEAQAGSSGAAGRVSLVTSGGMSILEHSRIATDAAGTGGAGNVTLQAGDLSIDASEVSSNALGPSSGDAGSVSVAVQGRLSLANAALISSSTRSQLGAAGSIDIQAAEVAIDGSNTAVRAEALAGSSGRTGGIRVEARDRLALSNGATLSIENDATLPQTSLVRAQRFAPSAEVTASKLTITAPQISLDNAQITAAATGDLPASEIEVNAGQGLSLRDATIATTAVDGNGGGIDINAGAFMLLDHAQVSTSVLGLRNGNGGDISLKADTLVMQTGSIQANTAAAQATGGNVAIDVGLLVTGGALALGGDQAIAFDPSLAGVNVIQAAAPGGVSGNVQVSSPIVDIAGNLRGLTSEVIDYGALSRDLCRVGLGSSFTPVGRGGLRISSRGWIRDEGKLGSGSQANNDRIRASGAAQGVRIAALECR